MRFDLVDLRLFCEVADAGSITRGAERCALALAAASTRIRNMEDALGAPLLERSRQGVTPTPAGRTLLKHARTILSQTARLREDLGAYAGGLNVRDQAFAGLFVRPPLAGALGPARVRAIGWKQLTDD